MERAIIHVDMDAFYAAVEARDNPALAGKPLIIGGLPNEPRGVVSTCSYEARKYGVRSAMSIREAYQRCPDGIYMHPNMRKYAQVSDALHVIWGDFTNAIEFVSLDEGYLDVTGSLHIFGGAKRIAEMIKSRTRDELGLTCSVGVGYSLSSAKLASEEKKPNGYFEIPDDTFYRNLIIDRDVRILFGVGVKSAAQLRELGIVTVRDLLRAQDIVRSNFGSHGQQMLEMARGIDPREVTPFYESEMKSLGREQTFPQDVTDYRILQGLLRAFAKEISDKLIASGLFAQTVTLKITYGSMKSITRTKSGEPTNRAADIYTAAAALLDAIERKPIRLAGVSTSHFSKESYHQLSLTDLQSAPKQRRKDALERKMRELEQKFGKGIVRTARELEDERYTDGQMLGQSHPPDED